MAIGGAGESLERIIIEIRAQWDQAQKALDALRTKLQELEKQAGQTATEVSQNLSDMSLEVAAATDIVEHQLTNMAAGLATTFGIAAIEAGKSAEIMNRLAINVRGQGGDWEALRDELEQTLETMSDLSGVAQDDLAQGLTSAMSVGNNLAQSMALVEGAMKIARATGQDFSTLLYRLQIGAQGYGRYLVRLGLITKEQAKDGYDMDAVLAKINERYAETAQRIPSVTRALGFFRTAAGNLLSTLGRPLQEPLSKFIYGIVDLINKLREFVQSLDPTTVRLVAFISVILGGPAAVGGFLKAFMNVPFLGAFARGLLTAGSQLATFLGIVRGGGGVVIAFRGILAGLLTVFSPIRLAIIALAIAWQQNWFGIRDVVLRIIPILGLWFRNLIENIGEVVSWIREHLGPVWAWLGEKITDFVRVAGRIALVGVAIFALFTPIGQLITAVVLLARVVIANWDRIRTVVVVIIGMLVRWIEFLVRKFQEFVNFIWDKIGPALNWLGDRLKAVTGWLEEQGQKIAEKLGLYDLWEKGLRKVGNAATWVQEQVAAAEAQLKVEAGVRAMTARWVAVGNAAASAGKQTKNLFDAVGGASDKAGKYAQQVREAIEAQKVLLELGRASWQSVAVMYERAIKDSKLSIQERRKFEYDYTQFLNSEAERRIAIITREYEKRHLTEAQAVERIKRIYEDPRYKRFKNRDSVLQEEQAITKITEDAARKRLDVIRESVQDSIQWLQRQASEGKISAAEIGMAAGRVRERIMAALPAGPERQKLLSDWNQAINQLHQQFLEATKQATKQTLRDLDDYIRSSELAFAAATGDRLKVIDLQLKQSVQDQLRSLQDLYEARQRYYESEIADARARAVYLADLDKWYAAEKKRIQEQSARERLLIEAEYYASEAAMAREFGATTTAEFVSALETQLVRLKLAGAQMTDAYRNIVRVLADARLELAEEEIAAAEYETYGNRFELMKRLRDRLEYYRALAEQDESYYKTFEMFRLRLEALERSLLTPLQRFTVNTISGLREGLGSFIRDVLRGTRTIGDAFIEMANRLLDKWIDTLAEMVDEWLEKDLPGLMKRAFGGGAFPEWLRLPGVKAGAGKPEGGIPSEEMTQSLEAAGGAAADAAQAAAEAAGAVAQTGVQQAVTAAQQAAATSLQAGAGTLQAGATTLQTGAGLFQSAVGLWQSAIGLWQTAITAGQTATELAAQALQLAATQLQMAAQALAAAAIPVPVMQTGGMVRPVTARPTNSGHIVPAILHAGERVLTPVEQAMLTKLPTEPQRTDGPVNVHLTVNAFDTQTGAQFLLKNAKTIGTALRWGFRNNSPLRRELREGHGRAY